MEVSDTDRAILIALCRPYIESRKFPLPATDQQIREELGQQDIDLDDEALRQRLRELFTEFGADGVAPGQRRNELVERVYASGVLAPWGPGEAPARRWHERLRTHAGKIGAPRLAAGAGAVAVLVVVAALVVPKPAPDPGSIDAAAGADIGNIDPGLADTAAGTVRYCTGDDVANGQHKTAVRDFNQTYGATVRAELSELGQSADQVYEQFSSLQRDRSGACDVLYSDVTWTADFARQGWLHELSSYIAPNKAQYVPPMLQAATVEERQWGVPKQADAGLLFYRKDLVDDPPRSWQDLYRDAAAGRGKLLRYQGRAYEGLTVNFLEMAYAAGAEDIVTAAGKANLNQQAEQDALNLMIAGIQRHAAPREVVLQQEEHNIRAFAKGKAIYMRNWPYAYARVLKRNPRLKGKIGVARLPGWKGGASASVLGGHIVVISAYSKNPGAALKLAGYLTSSSIIERDAVRFGLAPALTALWDDPAVAKALPAFQALKAAVFGARLRPSVSDYQSFSSAIYTNINRALTRETSPGVALDAADDRIQQTLDAAP